MKYLISLFLMLASGCFSSARAQHHEHTAGAHRDSTMASGATSHEETRHAHAMRSALFGAMAMHRDGSGTSWHPDDTSVEGLHGNGERWQSMLHGAVFLRYTNQDVFDAGYRGAHGFGAPGWIMGMTTRRLSSRSQLSFRGMLTGEPLTEGLDGYPLLFQTGETYEGEALVDWQHPHDLIAEISATWSLAFNERSGMFVYAALPGEPAIGPPAFMHRPSARHLPNAPIGHHWQDATHVTFGVSTLGFIWGPVKLDASIFTGREPDEERFGFDKPRFDSYSARVSVNFGEGWALQASQGFIESPEALDAGLDVRRSAVSALYGRQTAASDFAASLVWGFNEYTGESSAHIHENGQVHGHVHAPYQHSLLAEADWSRREFVWYGRLEWLQKGGSELGVVTDGDIHWIGALTVGTAKKLDSVGIFRLTAGAHATVHVVPDALQAVYGAMPMALQLYVRTSIDRR